MKPLGVKRPPKADREHDAGVSRDCPSVSHGNKHTPPYRKGHEAVHFPAVGYPVGQDRIHTDTTGALRDKFGPNGTTLQRE